jgi:hypothetical protein
VSELEARLNRSGAISRSMAHCGYNTHRYPHLLCSSTSSPPACKPLIALHNTESRTSSHTEIMGPKPTSTSTSAFGALKRYILSHPYDTAFTAAGVFLCLNPLALLGCGPLVPVAGEESVAFSSRPIGALTLTVVGPAATSLQSSIEILQRGLLVTKLQQAGIGSVSVALWKLAGLVVTNAPWVASKLIMSRARR